MTFLKLNLYFFAIEVGKLAPIATVMLPEANAFEALAQHLSEKRGARI